MKSSLLGTYLHDHLAGATGALELLASLSKKHPNGALGRFLSSLQSEIEWERSQLELLTEAFPIRTGVPRKVAGWIAEKGLELKLAIDGGDESLFRLFESLEALSVGIAGKRLLWRCLRNQEGLSKAAAELDYARLIAMAVRQRRELEPFRLAAAAQAFSDEIATSEERSADRASAEA